MPDRRVRVAVVVAAALLAVLVISAAAFGGFALGRSQAPDAGSVDVGFLQDMIDHHDQAVLISTIVLRNDPSEQVRNLAIDIIASQRYEIGMMEGWLTEWDHGRGGAGRDAMRWMGHPVAVAEMPGMASTDQLGALTRARGRDADRLFVELMIDHHEGGVHMGEQAAERAGDGDVRWIGGHMARNQRREIRHLESLDASLRSAAGGADG